MDAKDVSRFFEPYLFLDPEYVDDFDEKLRSTLRERFESMDEAEIRPYFPDYDRIVDFARGKNKSLSVYERKMATVFCQQTMIRSDNTNESSLEYVYRLNFAGNGPTFDMEFRFRDDGQGFPQLVCGEMIGRTWGEIVRVPMPPDMERTLFAELVDSGMIRLPVNAYDEPPTMGY